MDQEKPIHGVVSLIPVRIEQEMPAQLNYMFYSPLADLKKNLNTFCCMKQPCHGAFP